MEGGHGECQPDGVAEVLILLERPASLTPELRAWINQRAGSGRAVLTRGRVNGSDRPSVMLRVEIESDSEDEAEDEVADLITDLRLLGLRPTLVTGQPVEGRRDGLAARAT